MAHYWMFRGSAAIEAAEPLDVFDPLLRTSTEAGFSGLRFDGRVTSTQCVSSQTQADKEMVSIPPFEIAHQKGSSIIRMMERVITQSTFDSGVLNYIRAK